MSTFLGRKMVDVVREVVFCSTCLAGLVLWFCGAADAIA